MIWVIWVFLRLLFCIVVFPTFQWTVLKEMMNSSSKPWGQWDFCYDFFSRIFCLDVSLRSSTSFIESHTFWFFSLLNPRTQSMPASQEEWESITSMSRDWKWLKRSTHQPLSFLPQEQRPLKIVWHIHPKC